MSDPVTLTVILFSIAVGLGSIMIKTDFSVDPDYSAVNKELSPQRMRDYLTNERRIWFCKGIWAVTLIALVFRNVFDK